MLDSNIKTILEGLTKKELRQIANAKKIRIPNTWDKSVIVELLTINISILDIEKIKVKSLKSEIIAKKKIAISMKHLVKKYEDVTAVDDLNLDIFEGELFSLLGPNGAGKTTTINILNGIIKPSKGSATVGGFDVSCESDKIKKIIGVCPQEASVFSFLNARENIEIFGKLHSVANEKIDARTDNFLKLLGLENASKRKAGNYSGGMLRKLSLIMGLISDPEIIFLDEPTVGMDARARRKTWEFINSLKSENKTIVLTTHYIEEAEVLSNRVGIIDYGKLVELGTPLDLMKKHKARNLEEVFLNITGRRILEGM